MIMAPAVDTLSVSLLAWVSVKVSLTLAALLMAILTARPSMSFAAMTLAMRQEHVPMRK